MSLLGKSQTKVRPLNDRKAIEDGATFLSEFFVFSVAGSIIVYEAYRSKKKANERTEMIEDDIKTLQDEIEYLKRQLAAKDLAIDEYTLPKELKPKILKLGQPSPEEELKQNIAKLEKKYEKIVESESKSGSGSGSK